MKIEKIGAFFNLFYGASNTLIPRRDRGIHPEKTKDQQFFTIQTQKYSTNYCNAISNITKLDSPQEFNISLTLNDQLR